MERDDLFLVIFLSFSLSVFFAYIPNLPFLYPYEAVIAFVFLALVAIIFNLERMIASLLILVAFSFLQKALPGLATLETHLAMLSLGIFFIKQDLYTIFTQNVNGLGKLFTSALHGIGLFVSIIGLTILLSLASWALGITPDTVNVYLRVTELPIYILLFAIFFAPLSEEVFFRGFLSTRYGIIVSAIVFSLSHVFYNSNYELAGAFVIGLALAYYFSKTKNLVACMVGHSLYNMVSIGLMFLAKGMGG